MLNTCKSVGTKRQASAPDTRRPDRLTDWSRHWPFEPADRSTHSPTDRLMCYAQSVKLPISRNRQAYYPFRVISRDQRLPISWNEQYACLFRELGRTADEILTLECKQA